MKSMFYDQIVGLMTESEEGKAAIDYIFDVGEFKAYDDFTPEFCKNFVDGIGLVGASLYLKYEKDATGELSSSDFFNWLVDDDNQVVVFSTIFDILNTNKVAYSKLFTSEWVEKWIDNCVDKIMEPELEDADDFEEEDN